MPRRGAQRIGQRQSEHVTLGIAATNSPGLANYGTNLVRCGVEFLIPVSTYAFAKRLADTSDNLAIGACFPFDIGMLTLDETPQGSLAIGRRHGHREMNVGEGNGVVIRVAQPFIRKRFPSVSNIEANSSRRHSIDVQSINRVTISSSQVAIRAS